MKFVVFSETLRLASPRVARSLCLTGLLPSDVFSGGLPQKAKGASHAGSDSGFAGWVASFMFILHYCLSTGKKPPPGQTPRAGAGAWQAGTWRYSKQNQRELRWDPARERPSCAFCAIKRRRLSKKFQGWPPPLPLCEAATFASLWSIGVLPCGWTGPQCGVLVSRSVWWQHVARARGHSLLRMYDHGML